MLSDNVIHIYNLNPASRCSASVIIVCKDEEYIPCQVHSKINSENAMSHFS